MDDDLETLDWAHPEFRLHIPKDPSAHRDAYIAASNRLIALYQEYGTQLEIEKRARNDTIDAEFAQNATARWTDVERVASWASREAAYQSLLLNHRIKALELYRDSLAFLIEHTPRP